MDISNDAYALVFGVIGGLLPVIGALIGVVQWLNNRFTALDKRLSVLEHQIENTEDKIDLLGSATKESIAHARSRFFYEIEGIRRELGDDLADLKGYLVREGGFIPRVNRDKDI